MIKLHRLNGQDVVINAELIESIDCVPDTVINLYTNNRFVVKESMDEVYALIMQYKKAIYTPTVESFNKSSILNDLKGKKPDVQP
jgi:flagellar protein FlbD